MLVPSSHRPIPLIRRSDLQVCEQSCRDGEHVLVKDPLSLAYYQLPILQYRILDALDGQRSLNEILNHIHETGSTISIGAAEIFRLIMDLAGKGLIWSRRTGTADGFLRRADEEGWRCFWASIRNPFFIRLPGISPGIILARASQALGWFYSTPAVACVALFVILSWLGLLLTAETLIRELPTTYSLVTGHGIWTLWIVVGLLKVFHELSHGMACERFGAQCHSIGFAFLFFSPCMYCDVSDAWLLPRKWHRIAISTAGVYVELLISAIGFWVWRFSGPGIVHEISLQVFLAGSLATLLFNANPLLRFDGYYVLSDLLEIPNLYQRSRIALRRLAARWFLGIRVPDDEPESKRQSLTVLIGYGLASTAYQIPMLLGLWLFVFQFLDSLGLAAIAVLYLVFAAIVSARQLLAWKSQTNQGPASARPSRFNLTVTSVIVITGLTGIWFFPLGHSMTSPVMMEHRSANPVYIETPGTVRRVCVSEGDRVESGTVLLELEDLKLDQRLVALEGLHTAHGIDLRMAKSIGDPDLMTLARTAQESTAAQLSHLRAEKERLQLKATVSGTIVSANEYSPDFETISKAENEARAGLLNSQLIGSYLNRRACVCEIAPAHLWQADIWIDQRQRQYLSAGQRIAVRLDAFSATELKGILQSVNKAHENTIPEVLTTKYGGPINTTSSAAGEVPREPIYRGTVVFENVDLPVQPGMRGMGRFTGPAMTVGSWLLDELHRVFVVR